MQQVYQWREFTALTPAIKELDTEVIDLLAQASIVVRFTGLDPD